VRDAGVEGGVDDLARACDVDATAEVVRPEADGRKVDHVGSRSSSAASVSSSSAV
jgi:hypothetical protein